MSKATTTHDGPVASVVEEQATYGALPLLKRERVWKAGDFSWVTLSLAIATWAFLTGGATVLLVGFTDGIAAMLIGNSIGLAIMTLGSVVLSQRLGVEQYRTLKTVFGGLGVAIVVFTIILLIEMGWTSLLGVMFGRAFAQISNQAFGTEFTPGGPMVVVFALAAIVAAWVVLSRGPVAIGKLNRFVAPGLIVIVVMMMWLLMSQHSWESLLNAPPIAPFDDDQLNFAIAVEFNLGAGLSWWPVMGTLARLTRGPRAAMWPTYAGILVGTVVAQIVGMAAGLLIGDFDPTTWMVPLGGAVLGILTLLFVGFANVTSMVGQTYSGSLAIRRAGGAPARRLSWPVLSALLFAPAALVVFWPGAIYDNYFKFLVLGGAFIAALCGVIIADYFILRRQNVSLRGLYESGANGPYRFHGGVNIASLVAVAISATFYLWVYNPITLETQPIFSWATASIPTVVLAMVLHIALSWVLNLRSGRGGYLLGSPFESAGQK